MINIKERIIKEAEHIINTQDTIRKTAEVFKISKSTIHKDIHNRLIHINQELYDKVNQIFEAHNSERHIKGGEQTKLLYQNKRK